MRLTSTDSYSESSSEVLELEGDGAVLKNGHVRPHKSAGDHGDDHGPGLTQIYDRDCSPDHAPKQHSHKCSRSFSDFFSGIDDLLTDFFVGCAETNEGGSLAVLGFGFLSCCLEDFFVDS